MDTKKVESEDEQANQHQRTTEKHKTETGDDHDKEAGKEEKHKQKKKRNMQHYFIVFCVWLYSLYLLIHGSNKGESQKAKNQIHLSKSPWFFYPKLYLFYMVLASFEF